MQKATPSQERRYEVLVRSSAAARATIGLKQKNTDRKHP